jgi:acetyltransferase-like isoleucine patch superfamily enzyme
VTRGAARSRLFVHAVVALLPCRVKLFVYRSVFKYRIGARVRIGVSILDVAACDVGDDVEIGHGNLIFQVGHLTLGDHARIGHLNIVRGGAAVTIGRYADILRLNEINSIVDPRVDRPVDPRFVLGTGSTITTGHKIDFTDRVDIGRMTVLGGRHSSLWTHARQQTGPISIGAWNYLGSEIRVAPGTTIGSRCIVGMGAVVVSSFPDATVLGGVPARAIRDVTESDRPLLEWQPRPDLPADVMFGPD